MAGLIAGLLSMIAMRNLPARNLITIAYQLQSFQLIGAPEWTRTTKYDIVVIGQMGSPVSDETSLTGTYDVTLRWSTDVAPTDDSPTFVTALQEQLGLKLEKRRVNTDVVIVDHIEHPRPD